MSKKRDQKRPNASGGPARELRNAKIRTDAIAGKSVPEIAKEIGLTRSQVHRILSSDETKAIIDQADSKLKGAISLAVDVLVEAMEIRRDSEVAMNTAVNSAKTILKSYGVLKDKIEVEHTLPKPTVIVRPNGDKVYMGIPEAIKESESK